MGGATDLPQRSSSPLKRRASSMDPEQESPEIKEDVDMTTAPDSPEQQQQQPSSGKEEKKVAQRADMESQLPEASVTTELPLRSDIPPLDHQIKTIETLLKAFAETPAQDGDQVYLVSRQWLRRAQAFGSNTKHSGKETSEASIGPVDNSDIISAIFTDSIGQRCVKLKPGMSSENFELFPRDAWDLLVSWYGLATGQSPIIRTAHNTAPDAASPENIQFEYHPPVFTIHRLWSANSPIAIEQEIKQKKDSPPVIVQSTSSGFHNFLKQAKTLTGVAPDRRVRLWRILQTTPATETSVTATGIKTPPESPDRLAESSDVPTGPPSSPGAWPEMLVDVEAFTKLEKDADRGLVDAPDITVNPNYNGSRTLALVGLLGDETLILDEHVEKDAFVSTFTRSILKDKSLASRGSSGSLAAQARGNGSGRSSPALSGPMTRGRAQQKPGRTVGCVGLQNLGNTCYMNSALQCVRSVEELTKYFLTNEAKKEVNPDNPLSHNGEVAMAYGKLLDELYKEPVPNSIAPRNFKGVIGRNAPAFQGYGQQDSQEFLGFLLDGLQEDLNRIKKKPYIEKPDSTDEMINNPQLIRDMATKVWEITKKRDDSVIADLFTGMYKSTLVCPECDKVSITFDPFNNLTLPLPVANLWHHHVKFFPLNDAPVNISVELDKTGTIKGLKEYVSARVGVPVDRLFVAEEFRDRFFKYYEDSAGVNDEIQGADIPTIHELEAPPTNTTSLKKAKNNRRFQENTPSWDESMAERLLVPVFHRLNPEEAGFVKGRFKSSKTDIQLPPPHFIVLTPEEAHSEEVIQRKVLEKMLTFTSGSELASPDDTDTTDPEMVNTTSDVDSADSKVVAKSVAGEDDMVDVTMRDAAGSRKATAPAPAKESPMLLKRFNKQRPKWINPQEFLDGGFQNLFEMSYFREANPTTTVPTGWSNVNEDSFYPRLSTRLPKMPVSDVEMQSPGTWPNGSDDSGSEEATPVDSSLITRMAEESSEEDSDFPKAKNLTAPRVNGPTHLKNNVSARGKNGKPKKTVATYGKKAKRKFEKQRAQQQHQTQNLQQNRSFDLPPLDDDSDGGPLLRLGEGLIVDWSETSFDQVFGGLFPDDLVGNRTYVKLEELEDPAIEIGKKQRALRKKNGIHLDDCLAEFEKTEILSEQDTWYCPRCKEHRRASKKFDLWKTPDILVVHLKRFSSSAYRRDKLDILVDFPIEGLDLTERVIDKEDGKKEIYDLIAVDDHWGGLGGGHYTAFAKNFFDDEWYEYNDSSVQKTKDLGKIITPAAYLLFYRRRSETPLGGPRFQEIFNRFDQMRSPAGANEEEDSGEGQRLGLGSSLRGSPSASTGAGPAHPLGSRGLVSSSGLAASNGGSLLDVDGVGGDDSHDLLPSYTASALGQDGGAVDDDEAGMTGLVWTNDTLRNSIEGDAEDEAISLTEDYDEANARKLAGLTSVIRENNWSFHNIDGPHGGVSIADDDDSNIAEQDNSSTMADFADVSDQDMGTGMMMMMTPASGPEPGAGYVEPEEPQPVLIEQEEEFQGFEDMPPMREPTDQEQDYMGQLTERVWDTKTVGGREGGQVLHTVPPVGGVLDGDEDGDSDKVAEIHVGED